MSNENTTTPAAEIDSSTETHFPVLAALKWRFLSGPDGTPLNIDNVEVVHQPNKDGNEELQLSLTGHATHVLISERNPGAGSNLLDKIEFPDGLPFDVRISLESNDAGFAKTLKEVSSAFEINPPLEDTVDEETGEAGVDRFFAEHPNTVLPQIKSKAVYIQVNPGKMKPDTNNPGKFFKPPLYFQVRPVAKRTSMDTKGLLEKLRAKRLEASACPI